MTARQAHIPAMTFRAGGGSAGITAKDALGNDVKASEWLKSHPAGDRNLVQGLKVLSFAQLLKLSIVASYFLPPRANHLSLQADATYLVVTDDSQIEKYGLNAVCTHLGCVVPWNNVSDRHCCDCCLRLMVAFVNDLTSISADWA